MKNDFHSVIIVGASIAGCTAALLYANKGIDVLVLDKVHDFSAYKKHCTHFLQPCCIPVLKDLDIYEDILKIGKKSKAQFWTSAGWLLSTKANYGNGDYAINVERSKIDPYLKKVIDKHPLITLQLDSNILAVENVDELNQTKVEFSTDGIIKSLNTNLLVAADGRYSKLGQLTENNTEIYPNDRFVHFAYYKHTSDSAIATDFSKFWILGEDMAFVYPLMDDTLLIALYINKERKEMWRKNLEGCFNEMVNSLDGGPELAELKPLTSIYGMNDIASLKRSPVHKNIAFIGDASLSLDPAAGTGCSFAILSASWLVKHTVETIGNKTDLLKGLMNYSEEHTNWFSPHIKGITADSLVKKDIHSDKVFYSTLLNNEQLLEDYLDLTGRLITPKEFQKLFFKNHKKELNIN